MLAEIVNTTDLWKTVVAAIIAGVGVTLLFSLTVLFAARAFESSHEQRAIGAVGWGVLAAAGAIAALGAVVLGVIVMTHKS